MASSVMGRPEEGRMHPLAKGAASLAISNLEQHLAKRHRMVVAIERHNFDWRDGRKHFHERFLWIKARDNTTVEQIADSYRSNCKHRGDVDVQFTLKVNQQIPDESTTLSNLDIHNDQYVIFTTQTPTVAAPAASITPSPLTGPDASYNFHSSTPNLSTRDTSWATSMAPSSEPRQGAGLEESIGMNELPPVAVEQPMFVQQDEQSDTPDPADGVGIGHPTAGSPMHGQESLSNALRRTSLAISNSPNVLPEQASQSGGDSPRTPTRQVAQQSSSSAYVPRTAPNPFGVGELAASQLTSTQTSLQRLLQDALPERLGAAVVKGVTLLSEIEEPLRVVGRDPDAMKWLQQIETVRDLDKSSRAIIGVVGNTGAGKSSVINALLDEERLVPTNCMRACTAVVTEISYNEVNIESARYRAEIEFIQPEDWRRELAVLFDEVFDAKGLSKDAHNPESIAGVAYAKIRAVYPKHTKDMLRNSTIDQLMSIPSVRGILGTTKCIQSRDCASFYQRLQHYVDSQQKSNGSKGAKPIREVQLWPLIKVVRIYTKADALATGAVIVDLPGVHDSNAARAAVAERYIQECTGLWIVAPITRAVDDKAAKTLLGTTFKRQLKYDGSYGAVTFICSKTDDISTTEAMDALQLGDIIAAQDVERDSIDRERDAVKDKKRELQAERSTHDDLKEHHDDEVTHWEKILDNIENGRSDDATGSPTRKRKRTTDHESADDQSLTAQEVQSKIDEHKRLKQIAREHGKKLRDDIARLQKSLNDLEERRTKVDQAAEALCITGRNDWSRGRIREDFAEGIKELDQENAAEDNPDEFDPEEDFRDYKKVASSLSVFCVSSRAYQKLSGRLQKDGEITGFATPDQTEIPQLQAHCHKLTEAGRQEGCRSFLNSLSRLLTSLSLWASDDGSSPQSSTQQRKSMQGFVTRNLQTLKQQLGEAVDHTMEDIEESLETQLFGFLDGAAHTAAQKAISTSDEWGAPREQGGMFWATYKATVRRYGVFHGASGARDFNQELTAPMIKELMNCWEKTFQRRLPEVFNGFPMIANTMIKDFHNAVEQRCVGQNLWVSRIARLSDNMEVLESTFNDLARQTISNVNEAQREINRNFTPSVGTAMAPVYEQCSEENGRGSFARMKQNMHDHVSTLHNSMFRDATQGIRNQLDLMCKQCRKTLGGRVQRMYDAIARDYLAVIGTDVGKERVPGKPEKIARKKVDDVISQSEAVFGEVLDCDVEQLKSVMTGVSGRIIDVGEEVDVEDATRPLVLSSDGVDEDDMAEFDM